MRVCMLAGPQNKTNLLPHTHRKKGQDRTSKSSQLKEIPPPHSIWESSSSTPSSSSVDCANRRRSLVVSFGIHIDVYTDFCRRQNYLLAYFFPPMAGCRRLYAALITNTRNFLVPPSLLCLCVCVRPDDSNPQFRTPSSERDESWVSLITLQTSQIPLADDLWHSLSTLFKNCRKKYG